MQTDKKNILNRLKRAEGQLRGIQKMIEDEQECIDIVTQLTAVRSSINRTLGLVISTKMHQIFEDPDQKPEDFEANLEQVIDMIIKK